MSFDFAEVQNTDESRPLEIKHPVTGKVLLILDLTSRTAARPTEISRRQDRKRYKNPGRIKLDPVELESDALDILVACTTGWRTPEGGDPVFEGQPLPFTPSNVRLLYERVKWIRVDADNFVNDVAVFLEKLPNGSVSA